MIYFKDNDLHIRDLRKEDIMELDHHLVEQHWSPKTEVYQQRLIQAKEKTFFSLVAIYKNNVAGHINLYLDKDVGPYQGVAYIEDLLVFEKFQNLGIASHLIDVCEKITKKNKKQLMTLSVGLHHGYGKAQRLYIKKGYLPDGSGAWYQQHIATPYTVINHDDDFVLYLEKEL